ncbi:MAG: hypothetical protein JXB85_14855 [Anaerolineales bacterium]|nr:hypothetical protein [Anaerolineales bacterium]
MFRRALYLCLLSGALLACTLGTAPIQILPTLAPGAGDSQSSPTPTKDNTPPATLGTRTPAPSRTPTRTRDPAGPNTTVLDLRRSDGPLMDQLATHARLAEDLGQRPILYFTAEW